MHRTQTRCPWARNELAIQYHDNEWGVPVHDDRRLFEFLVLEGAQAGLSWDTVLARRDHYREAFHDFDVEKIALFSAKDAERLLQNTGLIRNKAKIASAISNAKLTLALREQGTTLDSLLWSFVDGKPRQNGWKEVSQVPAVTAESTAMSKDLRKRGFNFVGPTICYALMQATGMVNDHLLHCWRYKEVYS